MNSCDIRLVFLLHSYAMHLAGMRISHGVQISYSSIQVRFYLLNYPMIDLDLMSLSLFY